MFDAILRLKQRRRVASLVRNGVGLHECRWPLDGRLSEPLKDALAQDILQWLRETMGGMRRPSGIDQVVVALACRDGQGRVHCTNGTGVIRPAMFYCPDGEAHVRTFLESLDHVPEGGRGEVVAALLSLGDIAHALQELPRAA